MDNGRGDSVSDHETRDKVAACRAVLDRLISASREIDFSPTRPLHD